MLALWLWVQGCWGFACFGDGSWEYLKNLPRFYVIPSLQGQTLNCLNSKKSAAGLLGGFEMLSISAPRRTVGSSHWPRRGSNLGHNFEFNKLKVTKNPTPNPTDHVGSNAGDDHSGNENNNLK